MEADEMLTGQGNTDSDVSDEQSNGSEAEDQHTETAEDETTETETEENSEDTETEDENGENEDEEASGAPEGDYDDFVLPEGMELDTAALEAAVPVFKELDLTQEQAQKLVDLKVKEAEANQAKVVEFFEDRDKNWMEELRDDKEFGGEKLGANFKLADRFLATFDPEGELVKEVKGKDGEVSYTGLLAETRLQMAPPLLRVFTRAAKAMSDDTLVGGSKPKKNTGKKPLYERLWPDD